MVLIDNSWLPLLDKSKAKMDYIVSMKEKKKASMARNHSYMLQVEVKIFLEAFAHKKHVKELEKKIKLCSRRGKARTVLLKERTALLLSKNNLSTDVQMCLNKTHYAETVT